MGAGTTIRLDNCDELRSHPSAKYLVDGVGAVEAEEIRIGELIRYGKKAGRVISSVTWRISAEGGRHIKTSDILL